MLSSGLPRYDLQELFCYLASVDTLLLKMQSTAAHAISPFSQQRQSWLALSKITHAQFAIYPTDPPLCSFVTIAIKAFIWNALPLLSKRFPKVTGSAFLVHT
jgi:hypothetical protein